MKRQINIINYCEKTSEYLKPTSFEEIKEKYQKAKENHQKKVAIKVIEARMPY